MNTTLNNDKITKNFFVGDAKAKNSIIEAILLLVLIYLEKNEQNITGFTFVDTRDFWVKEDEMAMVSKLDAFCFASPAIPSLYFGGSFTCSC